MTHCPGLPDGPVQNGHPGLAWPATTPEFIVVGPAHEARVTADADGLAGHVGAVLAANIAAGLAAWCRLPGLSIIEANIRQELAPGEHSGPHATRTA